jgi:hypothetical protein
MASEKNNEVPIINNRLFVKMRWINIKASPIYPWWILILYLDLKLLYLFFIEPKKYREIIVVNSIVNVRMRIFVSMKII